ncbi:MAG TPA: porphobilinogen synthase [Acidimicrobiales bacterium]|jgi:porphobilinogen synthase|nr:porphobilinogen synthase [Acidimicrobiales bacterium]
MAFPQRRLRRLRRTPALRRMTAETRLSVDDLIAPLFVREGIDEPQPIASLPGVVQHTRESLRKEVAELAALGIPGVILFGVPSTKDADGSSAWDPNGIVQLALQDLRHEVGDELVLLADLCLDEYTDHGHCGVLVDDGTTGGVASVDNDATIELYGRVAVAQAAAGADIVAPSGMMDGQVFAIREALDEEGFDSVAILAYAAKYASALYGPFRDAVDVTIVGGGDRRGYQQDTRNAREALEEIRADLAEGADMVMVKPALAYLDVIARARMEVDVPLAAYHVSGEYAMVVAAAANGWIDGSAVALEHVSAIKRAGADVILTYFARSLAESLAGT